MGAVMKKMGFIQKISKEEVFHSLQCGKDSGAFEAFEEEYEKCRKEAERSWNPVLLLKEVKASPEIEISGIEAGEELLLVLYSAGEELSRKCAEAFSEGDGVHGMMMNAVTDSALFGLEGPLLEILKTYCRENRKGILERIEISPEKGTELQRWLMKELEAERDGFSLTSGGMFRPVKTCGLLFRITEDEGIFCAAHDCASCAQLLCGGRKADAVTITAVKGKRTEKIKAEKGKTLLDILRSRGLFQDVPCGGKGLCGKCRIQLIKGNLSVQTEEERLLSPEEREQGWRLACLAVPQMDITVRIPETQEQSFQILTAGESRIGREEKEKRFWGIAGDIGTTTIAMHSIDLETGQILDTWTGVNPQRCFGADVIARVEAAVGGKSEELRFLLQKALEEGIRTLIGNSRNKEGLKKAVFAGNTVMLHLLRGYDLNGLSRAPFHPQSLEAEEVTLRELTGKELCDIPVSLPPGISAFIGADVTAGIYAQNMQKAKGLQLLIDLGTNGEMVLGDQDGFWCASVPAGPALEGGELSGGRGSAAIEAAADLLRKGIMDETGLLEERFFETGISLDTTADGRKIVLTQKDIRELQLAKGAVRAGTEMLLKEAGVRAEEVQRIFLAGGLGVSVNPDKLFAVGMLPEGFRGRTEASGNTSLKGCIRCLMEKDAKKTLCDIAEKCVEVQLSSNSEFQECFIENMGFCSGSGM